MQIHCWKGETSRTETTRRSTRGAHQSGPGRAFLPGQNPLGNTSSLVRVLKLRACGSDARNCRHRGNTKEFGLTRRAPRPSRSCGSSAGWHDGYRQSVDTSGLARTHYRRATFARQAVQRELLAVTSQEAPDNFRTMERLCERINRATTLQYVAAGHVWLGLAVA